MAYPAGTDYGPRAMQPRIVKVGLVQTTASADKQQNLERTQELIRDVARRGAQIVCLQELFVSQYFCQVEDASLFDLAESDVTPP